MINTGVDTFASFVGNVHGLYSEAKTLDLELLKKIFAAAAEKKVLLEINSYPDRTDLKDVHAREAKGFGCKFVIDTDSHSTENLKFMDLGVAVARRAWLSPEDIVNTRSLKELPKFFRKIKL